MSDFQHLPRLNEPYALPETAATQFQRDGHIRLQQLATADEVGAFLPHIEAIVRGSGKGDTPLDQRDAYHQAFLQVANLWELDDAVAIFVKAKRFAQVAAQLLGVPRVRLYHDQALFKEPGGGVTFWHQDQYYWPIDTTNTVTMWMPLVDVPVEMGVLSFATRSHENGPLVPKHISEDSDRELRAAIEERGYAIAKQPLQAGDATFHFGWTAHAAGPNKTDRMRGVMTVIYVADGARVGELSNEHRPADLERWMPGLKPGDLIDSPLNPLL